MVRQETQDALLRPLETLQKSLQSVHIIQAPDIVMDDDEYNPALEPTLADNYIDNLLSSEKQQQTNEEFNDTAVKFRSSSLKFITQPHSFQEDLDKGNLSNFTLQNSFCESSEEEENLSDIDLFETPQKKKKRKSMKKGQNLDGSIIKDESLKEELSELVNKLSSIQESSAIIDKRKQWNDLMYQSRSYQWLIRTCASLLACSTDQLNFKVIELQNCLFSDWNKTQWNRKKKLISLLKRW